MTASTAAMPCSPLGCISALHTITLTKLSIDDGDSVIAFMQSTKTNGTGVMSPTMLSKMDWVPTHA